MKPQVHIQAKTPSFPSVQLYIIWTQLKYSKRITHIPNKSMLSVSHFNHNPPTYPIMKISILFPLPWVCHIRFYEPVVLATFCDQPEPYAI